uniref:HEAT repeat-containing protein 1 n=1 Tax=Myripristis murdjan TaxID=586833 RepID=A0A667YWY5_9TELE
MTSLALQLKRLALPQSDPGLLTRKEVASLLFDPKDAAQMDRSSFYALGCTGLEELLGIEPAFYEFQDTLFSRSSLTLERSVQSREVNDKLDAGISLFLTRLCPYFLLKPAQKCIEWLVHRFHIQLYNVDSLLACALPYHETKMFVRVVQLLNINEATNRWNWLHCLQKPGVPLARGTLITHCYKDLSFMDFICTLVTKSIKAYSGHSANCSQLRVIFSFYASTIVPALDAVEKVSDTIISKLLPYIQKGLKSSLADYKAATYMIVCQLAVKVVLEASLVDTLALQLSKSLVREPVLAKEGLGCLIVLLQNQKEGAVGPRAFGRLCCMSSLVETLQVMASVHDVSPLLRYLLPHLVHGVFSTCTGERRDHTGLTQSLNHVCLFLLLDEYLSQSETSEQHITSLNQRLLPLVRLFESKYGGALDSVIAAHVGDVSDTEQKQLFHHFLSLSMSSGKYQILGNSDTSLLLSLKHPLPSVRSLAVEHLMGIITSGQVRHKTTFSVLIMSVLSHFCYKQADTVSSLLSLLQRTDLSLADQWSVKLPVLTAAVQLLSDPRVAKGGAELVQRAGWSLLPFLVITAGRPDSAQLQLARHVAQSAVIAQHPLTVDWAQGDEPSANRPRCVCVCVCVFFVPSGEVWWNPEKLDTNTCCYLALICRLFHVVVNGAGQGASAGSFRELMRLLLQVHLKEAPLLFRFLCVLWGYSSNQGEQLDVKVGAVLQTQALYVGRALLSGQPAATLADLASAKSPVFPSLLACLTSPVREVRRAGLGALQSLSAADASPFQPITEKLLKHTEEIIADPSYISQALGVLHEESVSAKGRSQQKKLQASMEQLLQIIQAPGCPSYTACTLLSALGQVNGESVLSALLPLLDRLLEQSGPEPPTLLRHEAQLLQLVLGKYNEAAAPLLAKNQACVDLLVRALRTSARPHADIPSFQITALEQITKPFFSALPDEKVQQRLLAVMFDLLVESRNPLVANTVSSVFKAIAVDGELVANELTPPEKPKVTVTVQQTRRSKALQSGEAGPEEGAVSWDRVTLILELLQHKKKLRRAQLLVPPLFSLLASLEPRVGDQGNMEYTKQLLLSCLLNVCQKLSPDGGAVAPDVLDEDKFNVELVVQCVRVSEMPQTHHHALLLLGAVAGIFPEKVLHNIMPIFTFMGANIMRLDDAYSFQVISKTVQTVIPALIESAGHVDAVVARIVHVFTDALPHVPEHRRLPILAQLVTTLGPARFLWVLMLLLFKQHATHTASSASEKDAALERDVDFWISLCCHFEVSDQLTSLIRILQYLMQLPEANEPLKDKTNKQNTKEEEKLIFSVEAHSSKELRHFKFLSVSFMAQLLASARFIGKVRPVHGEPRIKGLSQYLLEEILRYIHSVARCVEENADKPTAKFWRALLNKSYDALDKVNALLPTDTFITVMKGLMGNQLPSVRRKAMELLNNKLQHRTQWEEPQVTVLLQLSGNLLSIVGKGHGKVAEEEEEQAVNRQTALYSLKLLCRSFGSGHQEAFVPVLAAAVELVTSPDEEKNVVGSALLCIAEVVSTLKALAIPQLPRLMPAVLHALTHRKELLANEIYLLSAVTAMQRVTETLPHFISPYLQETTAQVGERAESSSSSSSSSSSQLAVRLASLRSTVATKLPPRVLLPTVTKCYSSMVTSKQLGPLMSILQEHIGHMEKEQLNAHQSELTAFFLTALDFRAQHCQGDLEKTERIEGFVIDCLLAMVMKLSEVSFRPLFFKLFEWSKTPAEDKERLLTFYRLADRIADRLKGLFVLFAGNLVKPFADLLRQTNAAATDEPLFDPDDDGGVEKSVLLLRFVLDCLHKIFLYDTQRFLSRERADALLGPLVDQLENSLGGDDVYQQRVSKHLLPCIAQFAVAMGDDTQWKALNYQILLKTRHASSKVRFSSLLMLTELAAKLRENYMVLLPETVPFLAELMEDECEEVEHQVQKVIQEMENILGEPLQSYF